MFLWQKTMKKVLSVKCGLHGSHILCCHFFHTISIHWSASHLSLIFFMDISTLESDSHQPTKFNVWWSWWYDASLIHSQSVLPSEHQAVPRGTESFPTPSRPPRVLWGEKGGCQFALLGLRGVTCLTRVTQDWDDKQWLITSMFTGLNLNVCQHAWTS